MLFKTMLENSADERDIRRYSTSFVPLRHSCTEHTSQGHGTSALPGNGRRGRDKYPGRKTRSSPTSSWLTKKYFVRPASKSQLPKHTPVSLRQLSLTRVFTLG